MALIATGSNKEFKPVPEGSHMAVCFRVIDLGTQRWEYQGEPQIGRKVLIAWELHGESDDGSPLTTDDGLPLSTSKKYTLSLGKKANLRADLESWRGKAFTEQEMAGFDVQQLLGAPCMVTIKHEKKAEKTYANVASVTRFPAALKNSKPVARNELQAFNVSEPDMTVFEVLPDWIKEQIQQCVEWNKKAPQRAVASAETEGAFDGVDEEPPF
jgi:hypothetical protein